MQAGQELDVLIAEQVMKVDYCVDHVDYIGEFVLCGVCGKTPLAPYSDDIAAAWLVVEKLKDVFNRNTHGKAIGFSLRYFNDEWSVTLEEDEMSATKKVYADTAPLAICLAALEVITLDTDQQTSESH